MDRLKSNNPRELSLILQLVVLAGLVLAVFGILVYKAVDEGWFLSHTPIDLNGQPALLFFNRHKGCECALAVYKAAARQLKEWPEAQRQGVQLIQIDLDRRSDLGTQFGIVRAPAMLLVNEAGEILYQQDKVITDDNPLDLPAIQIEIQEMLAGK